VKWAEESNKKMYAPQILMGASNSRRTGCARKTCLAVTQSWRISGSVSWMRFPLSLLASNSLSISPSNPFIPTLSSFLPFSLLLSTNIRLQHNIYYLGNYENGKKWAKTNYPVIIDNKAHEKKDSHLHGWQTVG